MSGIQTNGNEVRFHRVSVLPTTLEPRAWYIVASGNNAELYITDNNGVPKRATNSTVIQEMIDASIGNIDFYTNEDAQDAVGAALTDTDTIDLIYDDVNNLFKADVKPNSITATELANNINISEFVNNAGYELQSNKGVANGYTPLNSNIKIPLVYIDDALLGNVQYHGLYDGIVISGSTDIPPLDGQTLPAPSLVNKGWYFISNADYTYSGTDYKTGDWIISSGAVWSKVDNTDAVTTVFGRTGNIIALPGDYTTALVTETTDKNYQTDLQKLYNDATSSIQTQFNNRVLISRTLNINGVTQDLSTNREWRTAQADTGVLTFGGLTPNSSTTINIGAVTGYVIDNETNPAVPTYIYVNYAGETNKTVTTLGSGLGTIVMLNSAGVISFQNTFPTSAERKTKIFLGKVGHPAGTITTVINEPDYITSPLAFSRDLFQAFNYINDGVYPSANGANLTVNISAGNIHGNGINFVNDRTKPNEISMGPATPMSFLYRTQTGAGGGFVTGITPGFYDNAGTITAVGGGSNTSTIQWIFAVPGTGFIIQYGQTPYSSMTDAVAAIGKEAFIVYPSLVNNAILIGVLVLNKLATVLNDTNQAKFFNADKLGQIIGAQAGITTGTRQTAYNNSLTPQTIVNDTLGADTWRNGMALDTSAIMQWQNIAGTTTASINGNGGFTGTSWNGYIPANDTAVIHNTGNESFTGIKSATNTGTSVINGLSFINSATNVLTGIINVQNTSSGIGIRTSISSTGPAFVADAIGGAGGFLFAGRNAGSDTFTVNRLGEITGTLYTGGAALTGIPTAPTAIAGTNTTQIATTAFVNGAFVTLATPQTITGIKTFNNSIFTNSILQFTASTTSSTQVNACIGRESSGHIRINSAGKDPIILNGSLISAGGGDKTFTFPNQSGTFALTSDLTNHITGSLTTNYIPKATGATTLGNSLMYDNGTNIGIGTTAPTARVEIQEAGAGAAGTFRALRLIKPGGYGYSDFYQNYDNTYFTNGKNLTVNVGALPMLTLAVDNTETNGKVIFPNGNVGIGTTSPNDKLEVDGNVFATAFNAIGGLTRFNTTGGVYAIGNAGSSWGGIQSYSDGSGTPRILSLNYNGGNVLIGTTTDNGVDKLQVNGSISATSVNSSGLIRSSNRLYLNSNVGLESWLSASLTAGYSADGSYGWVNADNTLVLGTNGSTRLAINSSGVIQIPNLSGTGTRTVVADASGNLSAPVSDERLKENIQPLEYGLIEIMKMKPVSYTFKDKEKYGDNIYLGNIAQDMAEIIPEATFINENTGMMGIEYSHLHAVYIKAIQDQQKIIEKLEERILQLENK